MCVPWVLNALITNDTLAVLFAPCRAQRSLSHPSQRGFTEMKTQRRHMLSPSCVACAYHFALARLTYSATHVIHISWIHAAEALPSRAFQLKTRRSANPPDSSVRVARPHHQYNCYKCHFSFMRQNVSCFVGYRMRAAVPQLLKVHPPMFKPLSNHIRGPRGTFPHRFLL